MSWATRRRIAIVCALIVLLLAAAVVFYRVALYQPPSCSDGKQNQDEQGIDCGGACALVCVSAALPPTTLFTSVLRSESGRVDVVAAIENRNGELAARNVPYTLTLYGTTGAPRVLAGVTDLPPHTVVPLFIAGVADKGELVTRAFVEVAPTAPLWGRLDRDPRVVPLVQVRPVAGSRETPRVEALLTNPSLSTLARVPVVVFVRDASTTNIIAASRTVVPLIPAQGSATALFTWNEPFSTPAVRVEVVPVVPLP